MDERRKMMGEEAVLGLREASMLAALDMAVTAVCDALPEGDPDRERIAGIRDAVNNLYRRAGEEN